MSRIYAPCKKCRRAGEKLFLKGDRCFSQKCAMIKRPYIPGVHGKRKGARRKSFSEYGQQMAEKQKVKWIYGIGEKQFKNYVKKFIGKKSEKNKDLITQLELRLDNVIFRLGWAKSRSLARQLVNHGHIIVNKRRMDICSYLVKRGDMVKIRQQSQKSPLFQNLAASLKKYQAPDWLELDKQNFQAKVISEPKADQMGKTANISKIIEFYSR